MNTTMWPKVSVSLIKSNFSLYRKIFMQIRAALKNKKKDCYFIAQLSAGNEIIQN